MVLRHLPLSFEYRVRSFVLWLARRVFGTRIQARSAEELAAVSRSRHASGRMPAWAEREIRELATFEPTLRELVGRRAGVGEYFIPWNMVHVGHAYSLARRQLKHGYACMVLTGSGGYDRVDAWLAISPRPAVIIDVDAEPAFRTLSEARDVDYLNLAAEGLNTEERAALLARLVLQFRPAQLRYVRQDFLDVCLQRHGLAMAAVARVRELPDGDRGASDVDDNATPAS
ncbi:MAG: hypothetical protein ACREPU_05750 [Rhodanobacteraceae bacterium]